MRGPVQPAIPLIAVVDDDAAVLHSLAFWLEAQGYRVCAFADAGDALSSDTIPGADCLVIDYALPDQNGVSLLKALRRKGVKSPAIIIASNPSAGCRRDVLATGSQLVEKPLMDDALGALVRNAISA